MEAALKTSFRKELASKSSPQAFLDDIWVVNGQNGVSSDDFSVDDLFDFTNEDGFLEQQQQHEDDEEEHVPVSCSFSFSSPKRQKLSPEEHFSTVTTNFGYSSLSTNELCVPADDVANLEWLSHFVEDSFSEHSPAYPTGTLTEKPKLPDNDKLPETEQPVSTTCFQTPVPAKARSKRTRTGGRVWSLVASPSLSESSSSSTSSSSSSTSPSTPWVLCSNSVPGSIFELSEPVSVEKQKKRPAATDPTSANGTTQPTRRCSHCGVTKTPQWRAGPMGAKTLCNACGVRFKSGRLLPEYRPACSPTFSSELHSNHHRKVIEMRRKKETSGPAEPGFAPPVVPSFG